MFFAGILTIELLLPGACSLKDKRSVVRSVLERSKNKFSVCAAEVGKQNSVREAELAFAYLGNEGQFVESVLCKLEDFIDSFPECEIARREIWCECL